MLQKKTFLAIIPARSGSKRVPRKNILDLAGKPLIAWSIEAGLQSTYIDKVIVTSDDETILEIAKEYGSDVLQRPQELASDTASSIETVIHTIENSDTYDFIVLLQPTSPLRTSKEIDEAIELLMTKKADAVISVCKTEHSPLWSNQLPEDNSMQNFLQAEAKNKRSQDLEPYYRLNGAIYIADTKRVLKEKTFFLNSKIYAYKMPQEKSIDIDTELDFKFAQFLINEG
ncbi:cytidylyltransferase domain-containing protein [Sulfurimonas paralvinellae]|uniref:Acylneuraminate cytidylyltransferase family protein n=1 Tax=Sulfurimonas paralvinellae TaxID=317658 RepID=A0A7M1B591_9BACT|nr:acylneuraminate cytidylyltransferase family protein [Sulfurimonas paralvinellae]QOP44881.1 acylneuraminate cytidylyltransferase family protein [Sulfurimonas paralvinellae]